jgi:hypothetical protein
LWIWDGDGLLSGKSTLKEVFDDLKSYFDTDCKQLTVQQKETGAGAIGKALAIGRLGCLKRQSLTTKPGKQQQRS